MAGQTLRKLIVSVSAETGAYQREMARAGRMGQSYFRTITSGNRQAADGWRSQQAAIAAQNSAVSSLTRSVSNYASVMVGALAVGNLVRQADAWNSINARLKLATSSTEEFQFAQKSLFDISQRTTTSFADNANLFTRSSRSLKEYGYSTKQSVQFTEALAKYRGRGLIQITGRANYMACGEGLGLDLIKQPELLEEPQHACMSAAWFWATRGLNTLADAGQFDKITQRINGGQNGAADRQALYARALKVLA